MNPARYDTEHFVFDYIVNKGHLEIKIKNTDITGTECDDVYTYGFHAIDPCFITIKNIFSFEKSPDIHIHRVGQFFTPWFKKNTDCRSEIERGILRFYALNGYSLLDKGPGQFDYAVSENQKIYTEIVAKLPDLLTAHASLKKKLALNYQDKGVSTSRGSTVFDTKDCAWIMVETNVQNPNDPSYLWTVRTFTSTFGQKQGYSNMFEYFGESDNTTNQKCFEYIMAEQKGLYGINPIDLDKVENNIHRLCKVMAQLELILDIPENKSAVPAFEE